MSTEKLSAKDIAKNISLSTAMIALYVVLYVLVSALVKYLVTAVLPRYGIAVAEYEVYIQILLAVAFGYLIVSAIATFFYWSTRAKYGHSTAVAVRNVTKIIGVGAMVAAIAGAVAGGAAGVALGGFIGLVIGFASQQVLGQVVAGLFVLISRPFRIGDTVVVAGEEGTVEEVSSLFTIISKTDGTRVLIPNNAVIGGKIYLKPKKQ